MSLHFVQLKKSYGAIVLYLFLWTNKPKQFYVIYLMSLLLTNDIDTELPNENLIIKFPELI